ncbi:MAG: hypothetical protein ACK52A_18370, partial [Planctomycetota bacterium]
PENKTDGQTSPFSPSFRPRPQQLFARPARGELPKRGEFGKLEASQATEPGAAERFRDNDFSVPSRP